MAVAGFGRQLRWSDFTTVPQSLDGKHDAATAYEIRHQCRYITESNGRWRLTRISVSLTLNSTKSWIVAGKATDELLRHEQKHYDIASVAARQLEARLKGLRGDSSTSPADAVTAVVRAVAGEQDANGNITVRGLLQEVQDRYDEDLTCGSKHGADRNNQARWELRVNRALADQAGVLDQLNSCPREASLEAASGG